MSISQRLGKLPHDTAVYPGHGHTTTIGDELAHNDDWSAAD
jgi:glyoxylase-like metal-dependent hydrolase (beta-lactamase superfamily II)